jgi:hypothetical protein
MYQYILKKMYQYILSQRWWGEFVVIGGIFLLVVYFRFVAEL